MEADIGKMEAQLEAWYVRIDKLATKAEKTHGQAKIDFHYYVDDLKVKRAMAQTMLDALRAAEAEEQEAVKVGLEIAWNDLETTFRDPEP